MATFASLTERVSAMRREGLKVAIDDVGFGKSSLEAWILLEPDIVILDEPTTALDVVVQRGVLQEIVRLRDQLGFAVLFITHDLPLLLEVSDRIAIMRDGQIVEHAPAEEIRDKPRHPYTRKLLESFPSLNGEPGAFARTGGTL